ncbi:unnamed protein product [Calypogeia fissa]
MERTELQDMEGMGDGNERARVFDGELKWLMGGGGGGGGGNENGVMQEWAARCDGAVAVINSFTEGRTGRLGEVLGEEAMMVAGKRGWRWKLGEVWSSGRGRMSFWKRWRWRVLWV